ncbi:hypothetical protein V7S43_000566 [Phytophthora oleae]|uniref:WW domain-containing protein n=1 Tax=Phytophthora oleae TaxID=2107226 RepID=A0ABD3G836_9STRA
MPPKSAVAGERLKKELVAQKARAEALKHLQSTGSGPSQRELAQQQHLRQKQTANATTSVAQRRVLGSQPTEASAADKFDPRVRDNTLHAVALRRAQDLQKTQQIEQRTESYRMESHSTEYNSLSPMWQEVVDPASGDVYYWNETTNETAWERPGEQPTEVKATEPKTTRDQLAEDWEEVRDSASGDVYFWNRTTNETSWERPVARSVSLAQALEAKAKLDSILKNCGNVVHAKVGARVSNGQSQSNAPSNSSSNKRPAVDTQVSDTQKNGNKRRKHDDGTIDPMDPTGTGGKWSEGLDQA